MSKQKREVTPEVVAQAIKIREHGGKWSEVVEATGFNGAILRPHMARAGYAAAQKVVPVKPTPKSIAAARAKGMSWYALSLALDTPEAKLRALCPPEAQGRVYVSKPKPKK